MFVTGYQIMDRLEELKEEASLADSQFAESLYRFASETDKPDPRELLRQYQAAQEKTAKLQTAQSAYNLTVSVEVQGVSMALEYAVKWISSVNRIKNQWTMAAQNKQRLVVGSYSAYGGSLPSRDKEHEYAERIVSADECLRLAADAGKQAAALKKAIRAGNAASADIDIDPAVFE